MRIIVGVGLLLLCPVLAGCSLFGDKRNDTAKGTGASSGGAFTGMPSPSIPDRAGAATQGSYEGLLAGSVVDNFNQPMTGAFVQVVDLSDPEGKTKLDVAVLPPRGEFVITHLIPGHSYKLTARVKSGTVLMAGSVQAIAPKPNIAIFVSEDKVGSDTPPLPGPLEIPGRKKEPTEKEKDKTPAAGLGMPIRSTPATPAAPADSGTRIQPPVVTPTNPVDNSNVVDGFQRSKPDAPKVDIPAVKPKPADAVPPPPRIPAPSTEDKAPYGAPKPVLGSARGSDALPGTPTPVPSCLRVGEKVENFGLFDLDGKPWEYRKDRTGKLVLLHFWTSTSPECLMGLKDLVDLQKNFGLAGLQIVSIAYEQGAWVDQVTSIRNVRTRYGLYKFVSLLGGGGKGTCPVRDQIVADQLPELVLLGEDGQIAWRGTAPDADRLAGLRLEIRRRLGISQP